MSEIRHLTLVYTFCHDNINLQKYNHLSQILLYHIM